MCTESDETKQPIEWLTGRQANQQTNQAAKPNQIKPKPTQPNPNQRTNQPTKDCVFH